MRVAELPSDEELRLETLYAYQILDTPHEKVFEELVELTQQVTGCSIVAIGFMDKERQWFKAKKGIEYESVERNLAICSHTIREEASLVVEDLQKDARFSANAMVQSGYCLRFYAGANIVSAAGFAIGTLCVADPHPRMFTAGEQRALEMIARQITALLETRLQNLSLRKRAEEIIAIERRTLQSNLALQEHERQQVGYQLHEGFAQTLAACQSFLTHAEQTETARIDMIRTTKKHLQQLMGDIRTYAHSLTPTTLRQFGADDMLRGLIEDTESQAHFSIRLEIDGAVRLQNREIGLALFRNVQEFLETKKSSRDVSAVLIRLKVQKNISLLLMDNCPPRSAEDLEKNTILRTIVNRTIHYGGSVSYKHFAVKGNALLISLPLHGEMLSDKDKERFL